MIAKNKIEQLNGLALAYVGDAIYEIYIRDYLIGKGLTKPNQLHKEATRFVSAKAQAYLMEQFFLEEVLTETELLIYKRGRNAKSHTIAKNADSATYHMSSGFEAVMGYLHLLEETERLTELITWSIEKIEEEN